MTIAITKPEEPEGKLVSRIVKVTPEMARLTCPRLRLTDAWIWGR